MYNWSPARIFRLVLGLAAIIYAIVSKDNMMGWAGGLLFLMGLSNTGCCGANGCNIAPSINNSANLNSKIDYEEVK